MEDNNKIKWGILGCGKIAKKFADDLSLSQQGLLHACASRNEAQASEFAKMYGAQTYFNSYSALAACQDIDVIYIATPHSFHCAHTKLCLNHKKHVLCEKPMGLNENQVQDMINTSRNNGVFLMEAMWTAFLPAIQHVVSLIHEGVLGDIRHIKADFGFQAEFDEKSRLFNPQLAGGSLLDIGIYPIFISLLICGYPVSVISKMFNSSTGVDNECTSILQFESGATASLYSTISCNTDTTCEIYGTKGKITIPKRFHEQDHFYIQYNNQETTSVKIGKTGVGYFHEIEHVNGCIRARKTESNIMTHDLSLKLIRIMDSIRHQNGLNYPSE